MNINKKSGGPWEILITAGRYLVVVVSTCFDLRKESSHFTFVFFRSVVFQNEINR